jgi:hypothetical protein
MKNLPFSKQWRVDSPLSLSITLYTECDDAWDRAKREVAKGYPILLLPDDLDISDVRFPVAGREVLIQDFKGVDYSQAKRIGIAVIQSGATLAIYLGPNEKTIFFEPGVTSWAA